jgi:hypothetical protein
MRSYCTLKVPKGKLLWPSENAIARQLGVASRHSGLAKHVSRLKKDHIRTIAKLDVFADHQLAATMPALSVMDDLYRIAVDRCQRSSLVQSRVTAVCGLTTLHCPKNWCKWVSMRSSSTMSVFQATAIFLSSSIPTPCAGFSKSDCITSFLKNAYDELKPLGVSISADIFGLTAWKTDDFGVGQVLEKMAPHLDIICPMFYPSHFPSGFLGKTITGRIPGR